MTYVGGTLPVSQFLGYQALTMFLERRWGGEACLGFLGYVLAALAYFLKQWGESSSHPDEDENSEILMLGVWG